MSQQNLNSASQPNRVYLKDYKPPEYWVREVHLTFDLDPHATQVLAEYKVEPNENTPDGQSMELLGERLRLNGVQLDGRELMPESDFTVSDTRLQILRPPSKPFDLKISTTTDPKNNKALDGLYMSGSVFCTQCEAEGFRKITYAVDRPDNMSLFKTTIRADKKKFPTLLSNGNLISKKDLDGDRQEVVWEDPFKKPCYLFALVAGDLDVVEDHFLTQSGRRVLLQVFADKGRQERCLFALEALKRSMKWDEEKFGREYDLDIFMIVAVDAFNMGAMENKGLNIFNSSVALASPKTATDSTFERVEQVIAHEYFHNWTGNRITCRDWFQLSLKEGLTVYRDQEYGSDQFSRTVKRIEDVDLLKTRQFPEDSGPTAHPVRPKSALSVENFYTMTVYEKGSELIRMMSQILGPERFRDGMDTYFEMFDGQAVTTDDFVQAMEIGSGKNGERVDLTQFRRWYDQAGTPHLKVTKYFDASKGELTLETEQWNPPTPDQQDEKLPLHIPFLVGFVDKDSNFKNNSPSVEGLGPNLEVRDESFLLHVKERKQTFRFKGLRAEPVVSMLRDFSAPVYLETEESDENLLVLLNRDPNLFNRWESCQRLYLKAILANLKLNKKSEYSIGFGDENFARNWLSAIRTNLTSYTDPRFVAALLGLPKDTFVMQHLKNVDPVALIRERERLKSWLAVNLEQELIPLVHKLHESGPFRFEPKGVGKRALKSMALHLLCKTEKQEHLDLAKSIFYEATHMTDKMACLQAVSDSASDVHGDLFKQFHSDWNSDPVILSQWIALKSSSKRADTFAWLQKIEEVPGFLKENPNHLYSSYFNFGLSNPLQFHEPSGASYAFIARKIADCDKMNPHVGARLASVFSSWRNLDLHRQGLIESQLKQLLEGERLSKNTFEILQKAYDQRDAKLHNA